MVDTYSSGFIEVDAISRLQFCAEKDVRTRVLGYEHVLNGKAEEENREFNLTLLQGNFIVSKREPHASNRFTTSLQFARRELSRATKVKACSSECILLIKKSHFPQFVSLFPLF